MKKIVLIIGVIVVIMLGGGIIFLHIANAMTDPKPLVACANQEGDSPFEVREGCEPGEKAHLDEVVKLLERLPAELSANSAASLTSGADKTGLHKALPTESRIVAYPESWRRTGSVSSMEVKVINSRILPISRKFMVLFYHTEDGWKLSRTMDAHNLR